jgi:hypothetical protein
MHDVHKLLVLTQSNILSKLPSDIRFGILIGVLVFLQLFDKALDLTGVLGAGGPKLGAVLANKPINLIGS